MSFTPLEQLIEAITRNIAKPIDVNALPPNFDAVTAAFAYAEVMSQNIDDVLKFLEGRGIPIRDATFERTEKDTTHGILYGYTFQFADAPGVTMTAGVIDPLSTDAEQLWLAEMVGQHQFTDGYLQILLTTSTDAVTWRGKRHQLGHHILSFGHLSLDEEPQKTSDRSS